MTFKDAITLGRISNLPTVWTNVLAAFVLVSGEVPLVSGLACCLAMSLMYTGGMYLNDAFDRKFDAVHRPARPIPSGRTTARTVFTAGFLQLGLGTLLLAVVGWNNKPQHVWLALLGALGLAVVIVLYDAFHKGNPLSPLVMGLCRVGVYTGVALATVGTLPESLLLGALVLLGYLIGLTYTAKQENLGRVTSWWPLLFLLSPFVFVARHRPDASWAYVFPLALAVVILRALSLLRQRPPRVPRAVVTFIAGIALVDASLVAMSGQWVVALLCAVGFGLTLLLQRWVSGT
jgi:4-hydroxybenzoate polyprenyltransferase